ncbi:MAG: HAMP domain-containing histidine kinase [Cellvibrionaceae bacterium]|nr:HAMP domain-containing histidine kinase [Cellvibrionaceae bacterium]
MVSTTADRQKKNWRLLHAILFFQEDKDVMDELDEQIWRRTRIYMCTTAVLVAVWGVFDIFIDFENLWIFLALRAVYTPLTLALAYHFNRKFFRNRHRTWAIAHYLLLIADIGAMVLWTDHFVKYLIGFSTIFWGASVIMLWRFWHTVVPGLVVIVIATARFYFFPHNIEFSEFITGLYYFMTCLTFTSIISAYGYWSAYQLAEKNLTLKKTQEELIHAEKMASLNTMVASIAHEINTPIGTAITASSHAEEEFNSILSTLTFGEIEIDKIRLPAEDGMSSLQSALNQLNRTAELVERLKDVAVDQSSYEKRRFKLREYIEKNVIHIGLKPILRQSNIDVVISGESLIINSYPGEFSQIFTNLILNSIYHGYRQQTLTQSKGTIKIKITKLDNNTLNIYYSDDGDGMSQEVLAKMFEPFFTTRGSQTSSEGRGHRGSGLGMSIVYNSITQKLNGSIDAYSQPQQGVIFIITLPLESNEEVDV